MYKKWFKEAKFGMMVHFGLYSLLGGEYKGQRMGYGYWEGVKSPILAEWAQSYWRIPNSEYRELMKAFNPICFDAEEWVNIAKTAGMEYIVVTTKHHEGFALFDSKVSDYNIMNTPYGKDMIAELAEACYKHSLKFGMYYSQCIDWSMPDGGGYTPAKPLKNLDCMSWCNDWDFPDNEKKNYSICFNEKIVPQVKELMKNYGDISLIWFDTPMDISNEQSRQLYDIVKQYQPGCLVNSRIGNGMGDYESAADNEIPDDSKGEKLFETPATMNGSWGYKSYDNDWKSLEEIKRIKNHLNNLGINYLLNVGPDHLGRIPAPSQDILKNIR